jgi:hypothetical protein
MTELDITAKSRRDVGLFGGTIVACDRAGGHVAVATGAKLAVVDLATRAELGAITTPFERVAVSGRELAVLTSHSLAVYRTQQHWTRTELVHPIHVPLTHLAFSDDGSQLAVVGETLIILQPGAVTTPPPALPVAALPTGFTLFVHGDEPTWSYAQLSTPSGWSPMAAQIVHARRDFDEAMTLAIDPATVSAALPRDADEAAIKAYALKVMPELFDSWTAAEVETGHDADFTLRVGRRDGMPWFETRELWRDGCEPYELHAGRDRSRPVVRHARTRRPRRDDESMAADVLRRSVRPAHTDRAPARTQ